MTYLSCRFCRDVSEGRIILLAGDYASFMYEKAETYDSGVPLHVGLCRGPFMVSVSTPSH